MTVDTFRFQQWHCKRQLTAPQYTSLTSAVIKVLYHVLSHPDDVPGSEALVRSYVQDAALHLVQHLNEPYTETHHEALIRKQMLRLAAMLAAGQNGLDASTLVDLAVVYGETNSQQLKGIYLKAFPSHQEAFERDVVASFTTQVNGKATAASTRRAVFILAQLFQCGDAVIQAFLRNTGFVKSLANGYQAATDHLSSADETRHDWLYVKTGILDILHASVESLTQGHDHELLFATLFTILEMPSSSGPDKVPFISQTLLGDYEYAFDLSEALRSTHADDARVDLLAATLRESSKAYSGIKSAAGITPILKFRTRTIERSIKGKPRAETAMEKVDDFDLAISQVLDIFPSYTPDYIRHCLEHPEFKGNFERLITALLEGTLPLDLQDPLSIPPPQEEFRYIKDRQNVWDNAPMEVSRLRIGKARNESEDILNDHSFIEQMKADILRRAEELSEDEAGEESLEKPGRTTVIFEDDDEDTIPAETIVHVAAGEGSDTDEEPSAPETILELLYLQNPKLFDRDAETRRSKARAELKAKTGWGDEQIEGWRIMLERNPKKDKILSKHEFSGNKPRLEVEDTAEAGPSSTGRGRGRGGRGVPDTTKDRAWKDKNKARQANHNRKRGHDKKMARVAG